MDAPAGRAFEFRSGHPRANHGLTTNGDHNSIGIRPTLSEGQAPKSVVLHFIPDDDRPKDIVTALRWRMAPGSYLLISHVVADDCNKDVLSAIAGTYQEATSAAVPRTADDIGAFFTGLDLVEPGLVDVSQWRPDIPEKPTKIRLLAGVGRKPHG